MKNKSKAPRHVRLYHWLMKSDAWRDLDAVSRALYLEMACRYAGAGTNNGRLPYSIREGAAEFKTSKATISRALTSLVSHGFIVPTKKGAFSLKQRHATEWRLTEFPCDVSKAMLATKDFMKWQAPDHVATSQRQRQAGSLATALPAGARRSPAINGHKRLAVGSGSNVYALPPGKHSGVPVVKP